MKIEKENKLIDTTMIHKLVEKGVRATNPTNIQCWQFRYNQEKKSLDVLLDPDRLGVTHIDPVHKAHYVGLGAAIENIVVASWEHQLNPGIVYFPEGDNKLHAATLLFNPDTHSSNDEALKKLELHKFIDSRHSNRHKFEQKAVPRSILSATRDIVESEPGFNLHVLEERNMLKEFARLVIVAETVRQEMPRHQSEIFHSWLRFSQEEAENKKDGIWLGEFTNIPGFLSKLYFHPFNMKIFCKIGFTKIVGHVIRGGLARRVSTACLLTAKEDDPLHWLKGGRLFERLALYTTSQNIMTQPYNCLLELSDIFQMDAYAHELLKRHHVEYNHELENTFFQGLEKLFGLPEEWCPLMSFALGYGTPPQFRSQRRSVDKVLTIV